MLNQLLTAFIVLGLVTFIGVAVIIGLARKKLQDSQPNTGKPAKLATER